MDELLFGLKKLEEIDWLTDELARKYERKNAESPAAHGSTMGRDS